MEAHDCAPRAGSPECDTTRPRPEPGRRGHILGRGEGATGPRGGGRTGNGVPSPPGHVCPPAPATSDHPATGGRAVPRLRGKIPEPQTRSSAGPRPPHVGQAPPLAPSHKPGPAHPSVTQPGPQPWTRPGPAPPPSTLPPASLPPPLPPGPPPPCYLPRTTRDRWTSPWDASSRRRRAPLTRAPRGARGPCSPACTCARASPPRSAPQLPACCAGGRPGRTLVARTAGHVGGRPC